MPNFGMIKLIIYQNRKDCRVDNETCNSDTQNKTHKTRSNIQSAIIYVMT